MNGNESDRRTDPLDPRLERRIETASMEAPPKGGPWEREIDVISAQIARFRSGDLPTEKFREFRLIHGIYGQRQPDVHMLRVKLPNGVLNADQLDALAEVAEHHGHGIAHLTTRQDVQYHHIPLEEFPALLSRLLPVGIGSREACGNSVRNVCSCPRSGVCRTEPFPVLPYAEAVSRFLLRHPSAQLLARKFKIAFSGCPSDCAAGAIHDLGAIAVLRAGPHGLERGFRILVGGGTGSVPYVAQQLTDFLPAAEILRATEAIVRLFNLHGNRRNRARARSKFLVATIGIEAYRALFLEAFAAIESEGRADLDVATYLEAEEVALLGETWPAPAERPLPMTPPGPNGAANAARYPAWIRFNTEDERHPGRRTVQVPLPLGDARPGDLRAIARIARELGNVEVRVSKEQNLLLRGVDTERLPWAFNELEALGLAAPIAGTAMDIVTCPGADTCNLGITTSKGLGLALREEIESSALPVEELAGVTIKISGCPNGCSQHHIANIGLHGVARKVGGKQAPHYQMHLGGRIDEKGSLIAKGSVKIPAKNAPQILRRMLEIYLERRTPGEDLPEFLQRIETTEVEAWLGPLLTIPPPAEAPDKFLDWGDTREFSTANIGVGECAGAGVDASLDPFDEVLEHLKQVRVFWDRGVAIDALTELNRAVFATARVVLQVGLSKQTSTDWESLCEFRARLIDRGHTSEALNQLRARLDPLLARKPVLADAVIALLPEAEAFLAEARALAAALAVWKADPDRAPLPGLASHGDGEAHG